MKEAYYFPHDYNARNDPKMQELLVTHGVAGIGIYWCIVEQLYEQDGYMPLKSCRSIAFTLHVAPDVIKSVISDFDLFSNNGENFWSNSVLTRIGKRNSVIENRKKAAEKRWGKAKNNALVQKTDAKAVETDANAMQMQCTCSANKIKGNKIKGNKKEENKKEKSPLTATSGSVSPQGGSPPRKNNKGSNSLLMPDGIDEDYREIYTEWLMYRKEIKKPFISQRCVNQNYNKLIKLSNNNPETAKAIINQSIANGWQGLFKLKDDERNQISIGRYRSGRTGIEVTATCADDYNTPF